MWLKTSIAGIRPELAAAMVVIKDSTDHLGRIRLSSEIAQAIEWQDAPRPFDLQMCYQELTLVWRDDDSLAFDFSNLFSEEERRDAAIWVEELRVDLGDDFAVELADEDPVVHVTYQVDVKEALRELIEEEKGG